MSDSPGQAEIWDDLSNRQAKDSNENKQWKLVKNFAKHKMYTMTIKKVPNNSQINCISGSVWYKTFVLSATIVLFMWTKIV